jgi:hypothetical protein
VDCLEVRCADADGAASPGRLALARHLEAGLVEQPDQQRRQPQRVRADRVDASSSITSYPAVAA